WRTVEGGTLPAMPIVTLRSPLRELVGGQSEVSVEGGTLGEVIGSLERSYPRLTGWVLDEQGAVRTHVTLFVNGERVPLDTEILADDRVHVLPAISGGAVQTAELPT